MKDTVSSDAVVAFAEPDLRHGVVLAPEVLLETAAPVEGAWTSTLSAMGTVDEAVPTDRVRGRPGVRSVALVEESRGRGLSRQQKTATGAVEGVRRLSREVLAPRAAPEPEVDRRGVVVLLGPIVVGVTGSRNPISCRRERKGCRRAMATPVGPRPFTGMKDLAVARWRPVSAATG